MPKGRREGSVFRSSPYPSDRCSSKHENPLESSDNAKEWEDARCPVCMEHPHNAILLLCASHNKGCRPFMCDTSHRHSNCFDQFNKSSGAGAGEKPKPACPLCRQDVTGFKVVESARAFMNAKVRSCSSETCEFSGTYGELRKHAREAHPLVCPSQADPERQRRWKMMQRQRNLGDFQSALGVGANSEGDYEANIMAITRVMASLSRSSSWSGRNGFSPQFTFCISTVSRILSWLERGG